MDAKERFVEMVRVELIEPLVARLHDGDLDAVGRANLNGKIAAYNVVLDRLRDAWIVSVS